MLGKVEHNFSEKSIVTGTLHALWQRTLKTGSPDIGGLIHFCCQHPCKGARVRGPSSHHCAGKTLILQPSPLVDEINDKFGKGNKGMSAGQLVKSTAEKIEIKLQVRVCAKDWEFLGYS